MTISGSGFLAAATVQVGGLDATEEVVIDSSHLTASTPALSPGTLNDVAVTNPGFGTGTLTDGWLADFLDVPQEDAFHDYIETVFRHGITAGCGGGLYCRSEPVTRAQMAVFLLKGKHGGSYQPPVCSATVFPDAPCPGGPFVDWINQLAAEGITGGCGGGDYCPLNPVTRQQMAVFLLKAEHGVAYDPPNCSGIFGDVTCPSLFADWIEQLYAENVTGGCSASPLLYCPTNPNTRGQMAVFLVKTFSLNYRLLHI
ncbi:MAG: S-layer homology domain-containing protein [Thermoanaerobaculia bacterium]